MSIIIKYTLNGKEEEEFCNEFRIEMKGIRKDIPFVVIEESDKTRYIPIQDGTTVYVACRGYDSRYDREKGG